MVRSAVEGGVMGRPMSHAELVRHAAGLRLPDGVPLEKWDFSFRHVQSLEWALKHLPKDRRRVAFQAGGNIGLWPRRMASTFARVVSCEPDRRSRECLRANTPAHVEVHGVALGDLPGFCNLKRSSTGSHRVLDVGDAPREPVWLNDPSEKPRELRCEPHVAVVTIDSFQLQELDLLQLDIEGFEWHAITGAAETIARCRPHFIQVELREHTTKYGKSPELVRELLAGHGYREVSRQAGMDFVFAR